MYLPAENAGCIAALFKLAFSDEPAVFIIDHEARFIVIACAFGSLSGCEGCARFFQCGFILACLTRAALVLVFNRISQLLQVLQILHIAGNRDAQATVF